MSRSFLFLLVIFLVAKAVPGKAGPDVDVIINQIDHIMHYFRLGFFNSTDFQRLEDVKEDKSDVTRSFEMLGDLFTNGIIGHFEDERAGQDSVRKLYVNTKRTSGPLSDKLVKLLKEFYWYDQFDDIWLSLMFQRDAGNELALEPIRSAFRGMVSRSKEFYDELRGTTAEQVGLQLPFRENEMGGKRCYASRLVDLCYWWGWTHNGTILSTTLRSLLRIMGPECESKILDDRYLHALQLNTYDLAQTKNFSGGESNRCFHKFFIRYHGYSTQEYRTFITNFAHFLDYERGIYGFCSRIQQARDNVAPPFEPTITGQLATIQQRLLEARCIFNETVSPCPAEETSTISTVPVSSGTNNSRDIPPEAPKQCVLPEPPTTASIALTTSTMDNLQKTRIWVDEASSAAKRAIGDKSFKYPTPDSALETYRAVGMLMLALLNAGNDSRGLYEYKALVFYPASDDVEYCMQNGTRGEAYGAKHNSVRFLVARYNQTQTANATGKSRVTSLAPKIQQAFSEVDTQSECDRLTKIDEKLNGALSEFGAVGVVKCARKFVWYELSYHYFQAAWTNAVDIPAAHKSVYSSQCGKIVLFP